MSNANSSAYPLIKEYGQEFGLTKLELFAAMAMQGLCADHETKSEYIPAISVKIAKALLEELEKKENKP